jgi:O-methyltransferase involved in polyketide biosynthesis
MGEVAVDGLGTIQETMLIPLWARAMESKRADAILLDPLAVQMVESIHYDFDKFARETKVTQQVACVLATIFDGWVKDFLREHPDGAVVEIGAGLDTRFERLDNGRVRWFDLDLPDSMAVRRRFFHETDRRKMLSGSVLDPFWIESVKAIGAPAYLFLAEAVLMYFEEKDVRRLLTTLADEFPGSVFAFDTCVPQVQQNSRKLEAVKLTGAEFRWGIQDVHEIEQWDERFKVEKVDMVMNHHRNRFPLIMRLATWLAPGLRRLFTVNYVRLGRS